MGQTEGENNLNENRNEGTSDEEPQQESSPRYDKPPTPIKLAPEGSLSFKTATYESKEMKRLMSLHTADEKFPSSVEDCTYKPANVFPEWVLGNPTWQMVSKVTESDNEISNILQKPVSQRSQDEVSSIIHWLMSVWKIADTMGFKRCGSMFKEFRYKTFEPGENIITEGDRGLVFYIIVSGQTVVSKEGIGVVGHLGRGKGFGEVALTQGKDLRTATVTASTKVEVLSLHKINYDFFVRDIQEAEKRENFQILSNCKLFKSWPKAKIEKMCNSCIRKTFEADVPIFKQGDPPEDLYIVVEGAVNIVKELVIVCKNRWPTSINTWGERTKKIHKPINLNTITRGGFFGEVAIIKDVPRSTSAIPTMRTVLISLDRREFLHLISYGKATYAQSDEPVSIQKYVDDNVIIETINHIKGGPKSQIEMGDLQRTKDQVDSLALVKHEKIKKNVPGWRLKEKNKHGGDAMPAINGAAGGTTGGGAAVVGGGGSKDVREDAQLEIEKMKKVKEVQKKIKGFCTVEKLNMARDIKEKNKFDEFRQMADSNFKGSLVRSRLENARRGSSIGFSAANKRQSLAGIDNEHTPNIHSSMGGKVVLRKNSSVQIDMLYNDFYKKLQQNKAQGLETPDAVKFLDDKRKHSSIGGGRSSVINLLRKAVVRPEPVGDKYNADSDGGGVQSSRHQQREYGFKALESTREGEESDDADSDGGGGGGGGVAQSRRPFTSPVLRVSVSDDQLSVESTEFELFDIDGNQVSPELIALARRKSMQANTAGSTLRFRNKSILSYRDAIEG